MKTLKLSILLILTTLNLLATDIKNANHWILNATPVETDVLYQGRDYIKLKPGFSYNAKQSTKHLNAKINETLQGNHQYLTQTELIDPDTRNIDLSLPVGSISGQANVTPTGAFTYSIPIFVSPGTNGMQPNLSVSYNSQGSNGILGWGWVLSGQSVISRKGKDLYRDGDLQQFSNLPSDNLSIDGSWMVLIPNTGSWGTLNAVYGTEVGNNTRITPMELNTDGTGYKWFKVETIDGKIIEYGNSSDSRLRVQYTSNGITKYCIVAWKINKVTDRFGNYMDYIYEDIDGESCLKKIEYTGNLNSSPSLQKYASIEFFYSTRKDQNRSYIAIEGTFSDWSNNHTDWTYLPQINVLDRIDVKYGNKYVRSYELKYYNNDETYNFHNGLEHDAIITNDYSLLSELIETGEDGSKLNATVFTYKNKESHDKLIKYKVVHAPVISDVSKDDIIFGDFNSDGITDRMVVQRHQLVGNEYKAFWHLQLGQYFECPQGTLDCGDYYFTNATTGTTPASKMFETVDDDGYYKLMLTKSYATDFNQDGYDDILVIYFEGPDDNGPDLEDRHGRCRAIIYNNNKDGTFTEATNFYFHLRNENQVYGGLNWSYLNFIPADYDGDGFLEIAITYYIDNWYFDVLGWHDVYQDDVGVAYVNVTDIDGSYINGPVNVEWDVITSGEQNPQVLCLPMNINQKSEIVVINGNANLGYIEVYEMNSSGDFVVKDIEETTELLKDAFYEIGDLNGDGLPDIVYGIKDNQYDNFYSHIKFRYNTGNGFSLEYDLIDYAPTLGTIPREWVTSPNQMQLADINGDGKTDIILFETMPNGNGTYVNYNYYCYLSIGYHKFDLQAFKSDLEVYGSDNYRLIWHVPIIKPLKMIDFNGDGNADFYNCNYGDNGAILSCYSNNNPLHLKSISDGYGNKTEITFDISTNPNSPYSTDNIKSTAPLFDIKSGIYLTDSVNLYQYIPDTNPYLNLYSIKTQLSQTMFYTYKKGIYHIYKGFLGFKEFSKFIDMNTTSAAKLIVEENTKFEIDNCNNLSNSKFTLNPTDIWTKIHDVSGTFTSSFTTFETQIKNDVNSNSYFFYNSKISTQDYLKGTSTTTLNEYNVWQNLERSEVRYGNYSTPIAKVITVNDYPYPDNPSTGLWYPLLKSTTSTSSYDRDDPGSSYSKTVNYVNDPLKGFSLKQIINDPGLPKSVVKEFDYNQFGGLISETLSHSLLTSSMYGIPLDTRYSFKEYDAQGRFLLKEWNTLGSDEYKKEYTYNPNSGNLLTSKDLNGKITKYEYDGFNRERIVESPYGNKIQTFYKHYKPTYTSLTYCPAPTSFFKQVISDDAPDVTIYYNSLGREIRTETNGSYNVYNIIVDKLYYNDGRLWKQSDPYYKINIDQPLTTNWAIENIYDNKLRPYQITNKGLTTTTTYSTNQITITGPGTNGKTITKIYDDLGNIIESKEVLSSSTNSVKYVYKANLKLWKTQTTAIDVPDKFETVFDYDDYGNRTIMSDKDAGDFTYEYNPYNEMLCEMIKDSTGYDYYKYYSYDALGRIINTKITMESDNRTTIKNDIQSTTYSYVPLNTYGVGSIQSTSLIINPSTTPIQTTHYDYDDFGRIVTKYETINSTNIFTSKYWYNKGQLLEEEFPSSVKVRYEYNAQGIFNRLTRIDNGKNDELWRLYSLDEFGATTEYRLAGNAINTINEFDPDYRFPISILTTGYTTNIQNLSYEWEPNRAVLLSRSDDNNHQSEAFQYDELDRLTQYDIIDNNSVPNQSKTITMNYNIDGSMASKSDIGTYKYMDYGSTLPKKPYHAVKRLGDINNQYIQYEVPPLFTKYNSFRKIETIQNALDRVIYNYGFDDSRILAIFQSKVYYGDPFTERYKKYYLSNYEKTVLTDGTYAKDVTYINTRNGLIAAIVKETGSTGISTERTLYVHKDYLGSIQALSEKAGGIINIVAQFNYDPWGQIREYDNWTNRESEYSAPGFDILERGYSGHEHICQFGLINMNARLYDPKIGSFLSPDNLIKNPESPQNYNRFSYALNNPLKYTDPSGNFWEEIAIAAAYSAFCSTVTYVMCTPQKALNWSDAFKSMASGALSGAITGGIGAGVTEGWGVLFKDGYGALAGGICGGLTSFLSSPFVNGCKYLIDGKSFTEGFKKTNMLSDVLGGFAGGALFAGLDAHKRGMDWFTGEEIATGHYFVEGWYGIDQIDWYKCSAANVFSYNQYSKVSEGLTVDVIVDKYFKKYGGTYDMNTNLIQDMRTGFVGEFAVQELGYSSYKYFDLDESSVIAGLNNHHPILAASPTDENRVAHCITITDYYTFKSGHNYALAWDSQKVVSFRLFDLNSCVNLDGLSSRPQGLILFPKVTH